MNVLREIENQELCNRIEKLKTQIFRMSDIYNFSQLHDNVLANLITELHDLRQEIFQDIMED